MKEIKFDVTLKTRDLYRFTMRHTYTGMSGIFSLFISISCFMLAVCNLSAYSTGTLIALFLIASLFTVIQPVLLYGKCRMQIKKSETINGTLSYSLAESEITVSQGENQAKVNWYDVRKVTTTKHGIYVYMSPVRAFIFPKEQCGDKYEKIAAVTMAQVKKYRNYIPEEENSSEEQPDE